MIESAPPAWYYRHMPPPARRTQEERRTRTRATLLAAARSLFATKGYADTPVSEVAATAGVSNGALYHLFPDKSTLMAALFEDIQLEVLAKVAERIESIADPFERLRAGCQAFLDAALEPTIRRIALVEARTALGEAAWYEIESRYGLGALQQGLAAVPGVPHDVALAGGHILLGALAEACLFIAAAPDLEAARASAGEALDRVLSGFAPA